MSNQTVQTPYAPYEDAENQLGAIAPANDSIVPTFSVTNPISASDYKKVIRILSKAGVSVQWHNASQVQPKQLALANDGTSYFIGLVKRNMDDLLPKMKVRGGFQPDFALVMAYDTDLVLDTLTKIKKSGKAYRSAVYFAVSQAVKEMDLTEMAYSKTVGDVATKLMFAALALDVADAQSAHSDFLAINNLSVAELKSDLGVKVKTLPHSSYGDCLEIVSKAADVDPYTNDVNLSIDSVFSITIDANIQAPAF